MRLGGWWRLWLVATGLYGVLVAAFFWNVWQQPTLKDISHHPSFTFRMSKEAQAVLDRPIAPSLKELENDLNIAIRYGDQELQRAIEKKIEERRARTWRGDPYLVTAPNGFEFEIAGDTSKADIELVKSEYTRVLQEEISERRKGHILTGLAFWLIPALTVCALGLLARWVYNGFKKQER